MNKKLIAIDLDGTTLNNKSTISNETKDTIKKLRKKGQIISISTGRPYR
ncbi:HAD hydrolase family protein, partial [Salmonella enterica]